jgi:DNA-binding response OmpR family regulator
MLSDLLEDAGFAVLQASDGLDALQQFRASRPDLIVLDLMLPGMSGWQFLDHTRAELDQAQVPVVVLTAVKRETDHPNTMGVAAWLSKPVDADRFLDSIERLAGRPPTHADISGEKSYKRVLIVEDDRMIRNVLDEHLSGDGYRTDLARTISEARARIAANPPSLIVLDLMLPGPSGSDFLRERQTNRALANIPVVVISAAPQKRLLEAKELGADAFLSKPFDLDALSALINTYVR